MAPHPGWAIPATAILGGLLARKRPFSFKRETPEPQTVRIRPRLIDWQREGWA